MAEYLSPNYEKISVNEQRYIFAIRNRMIRIENNFPGQFPEKQCICGKPEDQQHIYSCRNSQKNIEEIPYERIFEDNVIIQKRIYLHFKHNFENEENIMKNFPLDPFSGRSAVCYAVMDSNK